MAGRGLSLAGALAAAMVAAFGAAAPANGAAITNPAPIVIGTPAGPASPYPSTISVAGETGLVDDVEVTIDGFNHTFPADVGIALVGPNGAAMELMSGAGGDTDTNSTFILADDAEERLPASGGIPVGFYLPTSRTPHNYAAPGPGLDFCGPGPAVRPFGHCSLNSTFQGISPNGNWRLYVDDFATGEAGSIASWTLFWTTVPGNLLSVATAGQGGGTVRGPGVSCPGDCSERVYPGRAVTLHAEPDSASRFTGWSGACGGTGACEVTMGGARSVTANFAPLARTLSVSVNGDGLGTVTGEGISCPGDCTEAIESGRTVVLTAVPAQGSEFQGWTGNCAGATCALQMNGDRAASARFSAAPDTAAPETTLTRTPPRRTERRRALFAFSSSEPGAEFRCALDGRAPVPCTSPWRERVRRGRHRFEVAATDAAGNADASPAGYRWRVRRR